MQHMDGRERRSPHFSLSCTRLRRFHRTAGDGMMFSKHRRSRFCIAVLALLVGGVGSGQSQKRTNLRESVYNPSTDRTHDLSSNAFVGRRIIVC